MKALTTKQSAVAAFLREYFAENDRIPTTRVVAKRFGIYQNAASGYMRYLCEKGVIEPNSDGGYRFVRGRDFHVNSSIALDNIRRALDLPRETCPADVVSAVRKRIK